MQFFYSSTVRCFFSVLVLLFNFGTVHFNLIISIFDLPVNAQTVFTMFKVTDNNKYSY